MPNLIINTQNWMRAHNIASMEITSPSGNSVTFYKKNTTAEIRTLVHKIAAANNTIDISVEEMAILKSVSILHTQKKSQK